MLLSCSICRDLVQYAAMRFDLLQSGSICRDLVRYAVMRWQHGLIYPDLLRSSLIFLDLFYRWRCDGVC
ncbi:hypothetical protein DEO72_LG5g1617 [Vigna unguiculata]|uniref:Uncharacterized protein n=1 Tax=Vigna unguiculata TaxID=3917 RepID=A0A4D6LXC2_VIGUN|nr:hypothetical protein DEO72_LG5g1617 [Vigna unguiculata]